MILFRLLELLVILGIFYGIFRWLYKAFIMASLEAKEEKLQLLQKQVDLVNQVNVKFPKSQTKQMKKKVRTFNKENK